MNGATSTANVMAALRLPSNNISPALPGEQRAERKAADSDMPGALATARAAVSQSLGASGFVDLTGPATQTLTRSRDLPPAQEGVEDLKPGALEMLMSLIKGQIAANLETSLQSQAHVRPDAAVTLLT